MTMALLAALAVALILPASGHAAFAGTAGAVGFDSDRLGGEDELYAVAPTGGGATRLTENAADDFYIAFSPDGGRIAFVSDRDGDREIHVANADGSGVTQVTSNPGDDEDPVWLSDGRIAFETFRDGNWEVYATGADGSAPTNLTNNAGFDADPTALPGGGVVFTTSRDGDFEIFRMDGDGSDQAALTVNSTADFDASVSPDGATIAFASDRDGDNEVYTMTAAGASQTNRSNSDTSNDDDPAFSPDGTQIAFESNRTGNDDIFVMNADGSGQVNLTQNPSEDENPDWQPLTPADVSVAMSVAPAALKVGETASFTIAVTNTGPNVAAPSGGAGVTLSDALPAGLEAISVAASAGSCTLAAPVTCSFGRMASGASATVTLVVRASATGAFTNTASATSPSPDPDAGDNSASAALTVVAPAAVTPPAVKPPTRTALPALGALVTLPANRRCVSRRSFRIRLRLPKGVRVKQAVVRVNNRRVAVRKGARYTAPVDLRGLPRGRFTVKVTVTFVDGRTRSGTRKYRTCASKR